MNRVAVVSLAVLAGGCGSKPSPEMPDAPGSDAGDAPGDASVNDPIPPLQMMPGNCSSDGWCWLTPTPNGNDYREVFGTGPDNIWLVAWATVLQWNGTSWLQHHPPVVAGQSEGEMAFTINGTSSTNMWLIYETSLEHWDGSSWSIIETLSLGGTPGYESLWVDPTGDAWVTYSTGVVKRWHGGAPTTYTPNCGCSVGSIWGTSPTDIFITTLPAGVLHFDGTSFTQIYSGPEILSGFQGAPNDVWLSSSTSIQHWDGTTLTPLAMPAVPANASVTTMGYAGANDVWWWATNSGGFVHWDGGALTFTPVGVDDGVAITTGSLINGTYWLVGNSGEVATMDTPFHINRIIDGTYRWNQFTGIWGTADDNMYFTVGHDLRHWDGTSFTTVPLDAGDGGVLYPSALGGIRTNNVDELFVAGYQLDGSGNWTCSVFHFDGTTWSKTVTGTGKAFARDTNAVFELFVMGPGEAMGVGLNGYAAYFSNGTWQQVTTNSTSQLTGVFGPDHDHVWVSGLAGTLLGWDRANPTVMTQAPDVVTTNDLGPITGTAGQSWVAVLFTTTMWHNDGSGWVQLSPAQVPLGDRSGGWFFIDATHAWASSHVQNHAYAWDGANWTFPGDWTYNDIGATRPMPHLFHPPEGKLWAAGDSGLIVHP